MRYWSLWSRITTCDSPSLAVPLTCGDAQRGTRSTSRGPMSRRSRRRKFHLHLLLHRSLLAGQNSVTGCVRAKPQSRSVGIAVEPPVRGDARCICNLWWFPALPRETWLKCHLQPPTLPPYEVIEAAKQYLRDFQHQCSARPSAPSRLKVRRSRPA